MNPELLRKLPQDQSKGKRPGRSRRNRKPENALPLEQQDKNRNPHRYMTAEQKKRRAIGIEKRMVLERRRRANRAGREADLEAEKYFNGRYI